jgi:hypothetical protein
MSSRKLRKIQKTRKQKGGVILPWLVAAAAGIAGAGSHANGRGLAGRNLAIRSGLGSNASNFGGSVSIPSGTMGSQVALASMFANPAPTGQELTVPFLFTGPGTEVAPASMFSNPMQPGLELTHASMFANPVQPGRELTVPLVFTDPGTIESQVAPSVQSFVIANPSSDEPSLGGLAVIGGLLGTAAYGTFTFVSGAAALTTALPFFLFIMTLILLIGVLWPYRHYIIAGFIALMIVVLLFRLLPYISG